MEAVAGRLPGILGVLLEAVVLKMTLSARGLDRAAGEVGAALEDDTSPRRAAGLAGTWSAETRALGRIPRGGGHHRVGGREYQSTASSRRYSYYALGGLPAALAYRFVNTGDAMLGYHDAEREWLGKAPARLDDLANLCRRG